MPSARLNFKTALSSLAILPLQNLLNFIFYFKEKAKYLAMNLNVAKKFSTEDRTYSSSREEISSSFKSAQETSRKERKK